MRFRYIKRGVSAILVATILISSTACSLNKQVVEIEPMEIEEVHSVTFDFLGGKDVMPISGYNGPSTTEFSVDGIALPEYITDDIFSKISECGVNMYHHTYANYLYAPEAVQKSLELGEKYNVGVFVHDAPVCQAVGENAATLKELDERLNEYRDYPAFCGVYVVDEPGTSYFHPELVSQRLMSDYIPIFENLNTLGVIGAGNLTGVQLEAEYDKYEQYVKEYVTTCKPPYVSFDYYVHDKNLNTKTWFYNMSVVRHYAEEANVPFWTYIQAGSQWNDGATKFDSDGYYPTEGEFDWNINVALAYGTKGIEYFMLIQPLYFAYAVSTEFDFQRNGLIGAWGNRTQWWYYAKNINAQIAAIDEVLMNSTNKGCLVSGQQAKKDTEGIEFFMEGTSWRELESFDGNTLIGCFNYQGKTALYVVNYDTEYAQKITLNLKDSYNLSITQNTEVSRVNTNQLTLDMKAGEGVLVVFD